MALFYALVDAVPGKEKTVEAALRERPDLVGVAAARANPYDFLVAFEQPSFDTVDDFLQTHVRSLAGVLGIEVITDWDDHGSLVLEAKALLDASL